MQLFTALGVALYSIGPGRESKAAWTQVIQIAKRLKDTDYELRAQWGLWTVCVTGGGQASGRLGAGPTVREPRREGT